MEGGLLAAVSPFAPFLRIHTFNMTHTQFSLFKVVKVSRCSVLSKREIKLNY